MNSNMSPKDRLALFSVSRALARSAVRQTVADYGRSLPHALGAEDLESHALLALWDACEYYDPARGVFRAYALKAIRRRLRRALAYHGREPYADSLEAAEERCGDRLVSPEAEPWLQVAMKIERELFYTHLARLPERTMSATLLSIKGFGPTEIGRALGISRQRANQLPREAVVQIRRQLAVASTK